MDETNWGKYYDTEIYRLDDVGKRFRETGEIDPADFYTILVWKAERAKNKHKKRLEETAKGSFANAVRQIASELHESSDPKRHFEILTGKMAVLIADSQRYPDDSYPTDVPLAEA